MASLADRIKAAIAILEGKRSTAVATINALTTTRDAALKGEASAQSALTAATAQVVSLTSELAAASTDTAAETAAVVSLEALAAQP